RTRICGATVTGALTLPATNPAALRCGLKRVLPRSFCLIGESHGTGPVCNCIVTLLPGVATAPPVGDCENTHGVPGPVGPPNTGTSPAWTTRFAALERGRNSTWRNDCASSRTHLNRKAHNRPGGPKLRRAKPEGTPSAHRSVVCVG